MQYLQKSTVPRRFGLRCQIVFTAFIHRCGRVMPFKFFQKQGCSNPRFSSSLNSQRWRFLRRGLDDFREGFLPSCEGIIIQPPASPGPLLLPRKPEKLIQAPQKTKRMLPKPQSYTSRLSPMRQARNDRIAQLEYCLSQHPLALYPHLQQSVPAELFKEIMNVLNPEMLPAPTGEEVEADAVGEPPVPSMVPSLQEGPRNSDSRAKRNSCKGLQHKNPYTWFTPKEAAARELEAKLNYVPPVDENVKRATKQLCDGFLSLGGDKYNVDEDTVLSLFEAAYKTNFPIFLPIYAEELHNLSMDFRRCVEMLSPQTTRKNPAQNGSSCKPLCPLKREKIRYGAWYLDPKTWKKQKVNEPLENPKAKDCSIKNPRRLLSEKDAEFMQLHGTHAFREFLERKRYRIPEVELNAYY